MRRRFWLIVSVMFISSLLLSPPLLQAGSTPNLPRVEDPGLQKFLSGFRNEFEESRNRNTTMFCGLSTLTTSMQCENFRARIPDACTITRVDATVVTVPTGAAIIVDVNECTSPSSCTSIWNTTQANRVQIAANAATGSQTTFDERYIEEGNFLSMDIDQVGSTIAGGSLTVTIVCRLGAIYIYQ